MKALTLFLILFSASIFSNAQTFVIAGQQFEMRSIKAQEQNEADKIILYRNGKEILSHITHLEEGDCSSIVLQLGTFTHTDSTIIFYSYWGSSDRMSSILDFGGLKQTYKVKPDGNLALAFSAIYKEEYVNEKLNGAIALLEKKKLSLHEKSLVQAYKESIEQKYHAQFVDNAGWLLKDVRKVLAKQIAEYTNGWEEGETYGRVKI